MTIRVKNKHIHHWKHRITFIKREQKLIQYSLQNIYFSNWCFTRIINIKQISNRILNLKIFFRWINVHSFIGISQWGNENGNLNHVFSAVCK